MPDCTGPESEPTTKDMTMPYKERAPVRPNAAEATAGEPQFVNLNSYNTITQVIQNMELKVGIDRYGGRDRKWLFLECDGLP